MHHRPRKFSEEKEQREQLDMNEAAENRYQQWKQIKSPSVSTQLAPDMGVATGQSAN